MWFNDGARLLSYVIEDLIPSSDNILDVYAEKMIRINNIFQESINWLKH